MPPRKGPRAAIGGAVIGNFRVAHEGNRTGDKLKAVVSRTGCSGESYVLLGEINRSLEGRGRIAVKLVSPSGRASVLIK